MAANATVNLWLKFDETYRRALSIPVADCQRFAIYRLTWLRYVGFAIYGTEGKISSHPDGDEVKYYEAKIGPGDYYYISQGESYFDVQSLLVHLQCQSRRSWTPI